MNRKRYDVIEMNTKRVDVDKYDNEVIAIDLNTYERLKIKFRTRKSSFNIIRGKCEEAYRHEFKEIPFLETEYKFRLEQNLEFIIDDNGTFITVEGLDGKIK